MSKIRVGVVGIGRGCSMIEYCEKAENAEIVAICDKWVEMIEIKKKEFNDSITYYTDYDEFLNHDMDVVVLANYANEHAPFAIKALNKGFHVISEVLPCQTMEEAVELVETVERTGKEYFYAENYCYMSAPREMKKLYLEGKIGEMEYAEGEYVHNCEPIWPEITYGEPDHWRNHMYANFYCTHSIGPIVHICGLRPVRVNGFELPFNPRCERMGRKTGCGGIEMITFENGAILKSIHGSLNRNSVWYTIYGRKGRMESARESANCDGTERLYLEAYPEDGEYENLEEKTYKPADELSEDANTFGHGGSDFYTMWNCMEKLLGNPDADTIDVYEALDMFLPGLFAYRSVLAGGIPMDIPNLRNKEERDKWRNDRKCVVKEIAKEQWIPAYSKGEPEIDDSVYERVKQLWLKKLEEKKNK